MKCKKQPDFLIGRPTPISDVWEIRIPQSLFNRIRKLARQRKVSYSSVTRYCVFRLASHENLRMREPLRRTQTEIREAQQKERTIHRHMVCLYGDDARFLELAALGLRVSVSELIRMALWLYLPRLAMDIHSRKHVSDTELFWRGIKQWLCVNFAGLNLLRTPAIRHCTFASFLPWQWWLKVQTYG